MTAPLSVAQEALWYLSLLGPQQTSYHEAISIRKDGPLDVGALRRAFNEVVRRHAAWRSTFDVDAGEPVQVVHEPDDFELPVLDLSELSPDEAEQQAVALVTATSKVPYDLRKGPLVRPRLVRFPGEHHRLYLAMHHLVFDGVSVYRVVLPELVALYDAFVAGEEPTLAEPEVDYADYARFEQEWITSRRALKRLHYWRERLEEAPLLTLPLDHARPATPRHAGGVVPLGIPAPTVARLREAGRSVGATLFQVLATAWAVLLARSSGQDDVVFSTAADLRQRPEFESVVGYSLTPLVLRLDLAGARSFQELVVRLRNDLLDGLDNLVPFERIVRELATDAETGANPIYQTMVILEPPAVAPDPAWSVHQMESEIGGSVGHSKLDLELGLDERPEGQIEGRLIYDVDLFDPPSAARLVEHWVRILGAVADDPALDPATLLAVTGPELATLARWNATAAVRPEVSLHELVEAHARRAPRATALRGPDGALTYGELCARGRDTARRLDAAGVGEGDVVAFCAEPSAGLVADVLGALMAGAAYVVVDPRLPASVLEAIVEEAGAALVYADPSLGESLSGATAPIRDPAADESGAWRPVDDGQDRLCCVQYRMVEGEPRGVELAERAVVNLLRSVAAEVGLGSADTVLVLRPTLFEAGPLELWLGLSVGATVVFAPAAGDGEAVRRLLAQERVTFLHASPTTWRHLVDTGLRPARGLAALVGDGPLDAALAEQLLDRCRVVFSAFGIPETTLYATLGRLEPDQPLSVGRPIANTRVAVVDASGQPVPPGVVGQLVVAGLGTAGAREVRGAAEDAFVDDPAGPGVARVTGQRARWRTDGVLELVPAPSTAAVAARR